MGHPRGAGRQFAARVEHWQAEYYRSIAGLQNDARIAGNHALLAAAYEQFAAYLSDVWPGAAADAEEFATTDVAAMVEASAGAAAEEQGSAVFLDDLRAQLEWGRVRLEGHGGPAGGEGRGAVIGRVVAGGAAGEGRVAELSMSLALAAVQRSLRQQGRPPLPVSEKTLIAQLEAEGLLLDGDGRRIQPGRGGSRSRQVRIERRRVRVIRMKPADLLGPDDLVPDGGAAPGGS